MSQIKSYTTSPIHVEAIQFTNFHDYLAIYCMTEGRVAYVPAGTEHAMRRENEKDRSNNHVLDDYLAPAYVIYYEVGFSDDEGVRIDLRSWCVKFSGKIEFYDHASFTSRFFERKDASV